MRDDLVDRVVAEHFLKVYYLDGSTDLFALHERIPVLFRDRLESQGLRLDCIEAGGSAASSLGIKHGVQDEAFLAMSPARSKLHKRRWKRKAHDVYAPFIVLIDTAENAPFTFEGLRWDSDKDYREILVRTVWRCLGRHPNSLGDYSIEGYENRVAVERKSREDLQSTILGFNDGHRERFESELTNLERLEMPLIVVECTEGDAVTSCEQWGKREAEHNNKILFRSILSYRQDFRAVQWSFCDSRRLAEVTTFRWFQRFWAYAEQPNHQETFNAEGHQFKTG